MTPEELKAQLDELKKQLEASTSAKNKTEIETQIKALEEKLAENPIVKELTAKVAKLEADAVKNQAAIDTMVAERKNLPSGPAQAKGFEQVLEESLEAKKASLTKFKEGEGKGFAIEMSRKVVGNMTSSGSLTGTYFVPPTIVPGVVTALYEDVHMRNFLPVGSTNSNIIRYVQDNGGEGGPTTVEEGAAKPQIDRDLEIKDAPVRKIATYFRVPEEMIEDIPYLSSFLTQIGLEEVQLVEDTQILYGDGLGQNLSGFNTSGTAFAAGTSIVAVPNEFDVIGAAKKQIRVSKIGGPLIALLSPVDYYNMRYKRKDTTNNYIFQAPSLNPMDGALVADGVRIYEHTTVVANDFFVFSPRAAAIFDRAGTTVRFYDQDQDNAIKNLITIVIEKRLALPIYRPLGIIKGTISAAITDLTS
jgi:HK97 family phage major capsid protein